MANRPHIQVMVARGNANHPMLKQVLYGIEEEEVPVQITEVDSAQSVVDMAFEAAERSKLEVGIGMDSAGNFVLHHKKLDKGQPYLRLAKRCAADSARIFGNNSARIVKRMPLRNDDERRGSF
jgi:hypothetical protein